MLKVLMPREFIVDSRVYVIINFAHNFSLTSTPTPTRAPGSEKENELNARHFKTFQGIRTRRCETRLRVFNSIRMVRKREATGKNITEKWMGRAGAPASGN